MNQIIYRLLYRLTRPGWDTGITPPEVVDAMAAGDVPPGPALDLGCGTGTNTLYLARQGRPAFGVDFVPRAIRVATDKARAAGLSAQARFMVGDVTQLADYPIPPCAFALDMGCFHGLNPGQQARYAAGLAAHLVPGARYMLYAAEPLREGPVRFGITPQQVAQVFGPHFTILRTEAGKFGSGTSNWYWLAAKSGG